VRIFCSLIGEADGSEAVYALLRYAYHFVYGEALPELKRTVLGKPYFPEKPEIHFSLSHSKTHVLCGLSATPIGVDIETPRYLSERARRFFVSPEESLLFDPLELWVLKESYIKLQGKTIGMARRIRFSRDGEKIIPPGENVYSKLYRIENCYAAVSSLGIEPTETIENAQTAQGDGSVVL
jgi:4'-phosphopantetheinyl transferase